MVSINRKGVKIYVVPAGTNGSAVNVEPLKGEITNYDKTGGERNRESEPVFGGFAHREESRSDYEIEFGIIPSLTHIGRWEGMDMGAHDTDVWASNIDPEDKAIFIVAEIGSDTVTYAFNNAYALNFDWSHEANDVREGTMNFKIAPEDVDGLANFVAVKGDLNSVPDWSTLTGDDS